jgi:alpha-1,2-mannosyltransferase
LALVSFALAAVTMVLFVVGPMWLAPRPAGNFGWWLATESFVLYGLVLLVLAAVFARRLHNAVKASFPTPSMPPPPPSTDALRAQT